MQGELFTINVIACEALAHIKVNSDESLSETKIPSLGPTTDEVQEES